MYHGRPGGLEARSDPKHRDRCLLSVTHPHGNAPCAWGSAPVDTRGSPGLQKFPEIPGPRTPSLSLGAPCPLHQHSRSSRPPTAPASRSSRLARDTGPQSEPTDTPLPTWAGLRCAPARPRLPGVGSAPIGPRRPRDAAGPARAPGAGPRTRPGPACTRVRPEPSACGAGVRTARSVSSCPLGRGRARGAGAWRGARGPRAGRLPKSRDPAPGGRCGASAGLEAATCNSQPGGRLGTPPAASPCGDGTPGLGGVTPSPPPPIPLPEGPVGCRVLPPIPWLSFLLRTVWGELVPSAPARHNPTGFPAS